MNYFFRFFLLFSFFEFKFKFEFSTGCYRWIPLPYPVVTAVYRAVTTGKKTLVSEGRLHCAEVSQQEPLTLSSVCS
jgi:hypothetical protein